MDEFKYAVTMQHLNSLTTVKDLEYNLRNLVDSLPYIYSSADNFNKEYKERALKYKLARYAFNLFTNKSKKVLPDFIDERIISVQKDFMYTLLTDKRVYVYEELLTLFEFDTVIKFTAIELNELCKLHEVILDKPVHFTFDFSKIRSTKFDAYSLSGALPSDIEKYIASIRHKQVLSPDTPSTVFDAAITYFKSSLSESIVAYAIKILPTSIENLQNQINAVQATIRGLSNE